MQIYKFELSKPDGRIWIQYSKEPFPSDFALSDPGLLRPDTWEAPYMRFNIMRDEWISISASRQDRPFLPPKEYCPLCPQFKDTYDVEGNSIKTEVPRSNKTYEWAVFENRFPALSTKAEGFGHCEVILYSPKHESTLGDEDISQIDGLIHVWQDRSRSIGEREGIQCVFIFENKGPEIGVTLHHPHGQLYAFDHIPPFIEKEHEAARRHHRNTHRCLICDLVAKELSDAQRVVLESENLVAFVPYAARYPYEVHISSKRHRPLIEQLSEVECTELALMLKRLIFKYDNLFGFRMPYVMAHHQSSSKTPLDPTYHWHIEFYPPYRTANKLKYLAGVEAGTGFFINDTVPEIKAQELRNIVCPF